MGLILHLSNSEKLKIKNENLYVVNDEKETYINIDDFDSIVIDTTRISLTSSAILFAVENKVPIILCNKKHMPQAFCFDIYMHYKTSERIQQQVSWDIEKKEKVWREIIKEKIYGQVCNLKNLCLDDSTYLELSKHIKSIENSSDDVRIQEAISAKLYFKEMFGKNFVRHKEDTINFALNYGYSLLRSYISCLITAKGLHPSLGFSHSNMFNTYNFTEDIIEVFRPAVDGIVYEEIHKHSEFTKEFRVALLEVLVRDVTYKGNVVSIKHSINIFLDNILEYFNSDKNLHIPRLEVGETDE